MTERHQQPTVTGRHGVTPGDAGQPGCHSVTGVTHPFRGVTPVTGDSAPNPTFPHGSLSKPCPNGDGEEEAPKKKAGHEERGTIRPPAAPSIEVPATALPLRPYQSAAVAAALEGDGLSRLIVAPVGSGKTLVAAELTRRRLEVGRVLVLSHSGELVDQNARTIARQCPGLEVGILAGALGRHDVDQPVLVGNVATVHRAVGRLLEHGPLPTVIVDEAHRIDPEGKVYAETLQELRAADPGLLLLGLTGSPWRDGHGNIAERGRRDQPPIFDRLAYAIPHGDMVRSGFIVPVRARKTTERLDVSGVGFNAFGDYATGELDAKVNRDEVNARAIAEVVAYGRATNRQRWLVFAVTIDHAERLAIELQRHGIAAAVVSANTKARDRVRTIEAFRAGALRAVVNVAALTTGFDVPEIDLIALLRPTESRVLYYQMLGRGTRLAPGKADCVCLDFGGSVARLGCLEDMDWRGADLVTRDTSERTWCCPECSTHNAPKLRACEACGAERERREAEPQDRERHLSATDLAIGTHEPRSLVVDRWSARLVIAGGVANLVITMLSRAGGDPVSHALWFSNTYPGARDRLAHEWERFGGRLPIPRTAEEALRRFNAGELVRPVEVTARPVARNGRTYWNLQEARFLEVEAA